MKKLLTSFAVAVTTAGIAHSQGLYNIQPYDDAALEPLPLQWTAGVTFGYDDNPAPTGSDLPGADSDGSAVVSAFVQANYASVEAQTTWDAWARVGGSFFFREISGDVVDGDSTSDFFYDLGAGFNVLHRFSERLRLRSRTNVAYQVEPDFGNNIGSDIRVGNFFRYSSDNSIGYSWTERFATVTGHRIHGVFFDGDVSSSDFVNNLFYNQFRYRLSPATVLTSSLRYSTQSNDVGRDSDSYFVTVGAEHRFSPNTTGVVRVGAQFFDGENSSTAPFVEATLSTRTSEQFSFRSFVRYGIEDRGSGITFTDDGVNFITGIYDERTTLRIGTQATYTLSPYISLFGGVNVVLINFDDLLNPGGPLAPPSDFDEEIFNFNIGASYRISSNVFANASYNFTNASSDGLSREFSRNRFNLGVTTTF